MRYKYIFYIDKGGGFAQDREATPVNGDDVEYKWSRPDGCIFKRMTLTKDLFFNNLDYLYIKDLEESSLCAEIRVEVLQICDGNFYNFWSGYFTPSGGKWDHDRCLFTVRPEPNDEYRCFFEKGGEDKNVMEITDTVSVSVPRANFLESVTCADIGDFTTDLVGGCRHLDWDVSAGPPDSAKQCISISPDQGWQQQNSIFNWLGVGPDTWMFITTWIREFLYTTDLAGVPNPPAGSGWIIDLFTTPTPGKTRWVRKPYGGIYTTYTNSQSGPFSTLPLIPGNCYYRQKWFLDLPPTTINHTRTRTLESYLNFLNPCGGLSIKSDFLRINSQLNDVSDPDYVTGVTTKINHILIEQKSDAIYPTATEPASKQNYNWLDLLEDLRNFANVYWDVKDGVIRIEHFKFFTQNQGIDLTQGETAESIIKTNQYIYNLKNLPKFESWEFAEKDGDDFVGTPIWYDSICVSHDSKGNRAVYSLTRITTDMGMIQRAPDDISKEGFVFICANFDGTAYFINMDIGKLSGAAQINGHFSAANLQDAYQRWDRVLPMGYLNNSLTTFDNFKRNKKQARLNFILCCDQEFIAEDLMKSTLGWGDVEEAIFSTKTNNLSVTLRHYQ